MTNISQWNTTDGSNTSAPPAGAPENMLPGKINDTFRAVFGAVARWYNDVKQPLATSGSSNAYAVSTTNVYTALTDVPALWLRLNHANTAAATLQVDTLTAKPIKKRGTSAFEDVASGDLLANGVHAVVYDITADAFIISDIPVASSGGGGGDTSALETNLAHAWFNILTNGNLAKQSITDGFVDVYEDETGVDTGTSTNESHNSSSEYYSPTSSGGSSDGTIGFTGSGNNRTLGDFAVNNAMGGLKFPSSGGTVLSVTLDVGSVTNSGNYAAMLYTDSSGASTQVGPDSDATNITTSGTATFTWSSGAPVLSAATDYWVIIKDDDNDGTNRIDVVMKVHTSGYVSDKGDATGDLNAEAFPSDEDWGIGINYVGATDNMTLVSATETADSAPDTANLVIEFQPVDSTTLNTDFTAEVSRDGGTTWTTATLSLESENGSKDILVSGDIDISAQPTGTSMKYRLKTLNNKDMRIYAISMTWG